ncbi:hypothetical protein pEaSNUABM5_00337 [Erwinia phage pEa_SNUABM_5]|uniref:Uncharacterized protein n=1 Tax=Erwinia phage pEa_SNUABM_5 TaxID=2797313 RepID=A0A7T8EQG5_9CAUD|nr:hypothetical protein MPK73_gp337 [Erwinia phage pEa_SNUABM_5]QQO90479.1 hypothetical protein pEaSNUABM5_00337 [Erwinia phage pEa_SNUABM_5]
MSKSTAVSAPTRTDRLSKKLGSIATSLAKSSAMPHDIIITATQVHEVPGFITELTSDSVTIRHKKGHGSSSQVLSTFPLSQVIERVGEAGGHGSLTVIGNVPVRILKGQAVQVKGGQILATDFESKEVTVINTAIPGVSVSMSVNESAAAKKYNIAAPTKAKKSDKPAKAVKGAKPAKAAKSKK